MPAVEIRGGVKIEIPNKEEISHVVRDQWEAHDRAKAKSVKWLDFTGPGADLSSVNSVTSPTAGIIPGPDPGYAWSAKVLGLSLAAAGTVAVYKASSTGQRSRPLCTPFLSVAGPNSVNIAVVTWSSNAGFLQHDQDILVEASQNITTWFLGVEEVMSEAAWRIFD